MAAIPHHFLLEFTKEVFIKSGFAANVADVAAHTLIKADIRGIDSHGVARLGGYLRLVKAGRINPNASPEIIHETPSTATLNAHEGIGLYNANYAMQIAIGKAKEVGTGWVAVNNSTHFGIAAAHAELAIENDMIGIAMTNASPLVAPVGSTEAYLGTNPICYAIPAGKYKHFIADMATSAAANGKLEIAQRKGLEIPEGWALTKDGKQTNNAFAVKEGGTLLPLGSDAEHGYHKGYALGSLVDVFSGVLSGANFGMWVPPFVSFLEKQKAEMGKGIGHFIGAMRIDAFRPKEDFITSMEKWIEGLKALKRLDENTEILYPGEPEHITQLIREKEGIPLNPKVIEELKKIGEEYSISTIQFLP